MFLCKSFLVEEIKGKKLVKQILSVSIGLLFILLLLLIKSFVEISELILVFCVIFYFAVFHVFYDNYKSYRIIGYIEFNSEMVLIKRSFDEINLGFQEIREIKLKMKGSYGTVGLTGILSRSLVFNDGTGNILSISTGSVIYSLNCLIESEGQGIRLHQAIRNIQNAILNASYQA